MEFATTDISGLVVIHPRRFSDSRGFFMETYRKDVFDKELGAVDFVQDNESCSSRDVLRGLHFQKGEHSQAKLVRVTEGCVFDVAVDLRQNSPTFGKWFGIELSAENATMLFIPRGFAHGFMVLSEKAVFTYKVDNFYAPESEETIAYDDPAIGITWPQPERAYILSERDKSRSQSLESYIKKSFC